MAFNYSAILGEAPLAQIILAEIGAATDEFVTTYWTDKCPQAPIWLDKRTDVAENIKCKEE